MLVMQELSDSATDSAFHRLQQDLEAAYALNSPESTVPHVVVGLPSYSLGESLLSHYSSRLAAAEHRFLGALLMLRIPAARLVYFCSAEPDAAVIDNYFALLPESLDARERFRLVVVDDPSTRAVATKLLERPDLLADVTRWIGDDPAFIEPWNVTEPELQLALALGLPINGPAPDLWPLGFKSSGRKLFREAGVPVPPGFEDLRTVSDAVDAIEQLRTAIGWGVARGSCTLR
jgi:hypothetical protein